MRRVLVAVSGSVAALKLPELVAAIIGLGQVEVIVVTTEHAKHFYDFKDVPATIYCDSDEWEMWKQRSDPVLHIDLRKWADLMVIAPLDANTLGKVASGICDNLLGFSLMSHPKDGTSNSAALPQYSTGNANLDFVFSSLEWDLDQQHCDSETCVVRAWDRRKPLLFCPAMNTAMWEHPITATQIQILKSFGYIEVPCIVKKLVCGDEGYGAMAEISTIIEKIQECLEQSRRRVPEPTLKSPKN